MRPGSLEPILVSRDTIPTSFTAAFSSWNSPINCRPADIPEQWRRVRHRDAAAASADDFSRHRLRSPLVGLGHGSWAATRNSIVMVLVTGMTVGTIFTLFVVPVFYSLIAAQHQPLNPRAIPDEVEPEELTLAGARA